MSDSQRCPRCNGLGTIPCGACGGGGAHATDFGPRECSECAGFGEETCPVCHGRG